MTINNIKGTKNKCILILIQFDRLNVSSSTSNSIYLVVSTRSKPDWHYFPIVREAEVDSCHLASKTELSNVASKVMHYVNTWNKNSATVATVLPNLLYVFGMHMRYFHINRCIFILAFVLFVKFVHGFILLLLPFNGSINWHLLTEQLCQFKQKMEKNN